MDAGRVHLLPALAAAIFLVTLSGCSVSSSDPGMGIGPGSGTSPLTIYAEASFAGSGPHLVSLSELIGGSRTSFGVPIYWQIASRTGSARSVYRVGRRPPGFVTTVPFVERLQTEPRFNPAAGRPTVR